MDGKRNCGRTGNFFSSNYKVPARRSCLVSECFRQCDRVHCLCPRDPECRETLRRCRCTRPRPTTSRTAV